MIWQVKYRNNEGKTVSGVFQAENKNILYVMLQHKGYLPLEILEQSDGPEAELPESISTERDNLRRRKIIGAVLLTSIVVVTMASYFVFTRSGPSERSVVQKSTSLEIDKLRKDFNVRLSKLESESQSNKAQRTEVRLNADRDTICPDVAVHSLGKDESVQSENAPPRLSVGTYYTVQEGDTLYKIALKFYGKRSAWERIRNANKDTITSDGRVRLGQIIYLP